MSCCEASAQGANWNLQENRWTCWFESCKPTSQSDWRMTRSTEAKWSTATATWTSSSTEQENTEEETHPQTLAAW